MVNQTKIKLLKSEGFTLTELIIVVSIIAVLILIGIFFLKSNLDKANDAKRKADIAKIRNAIEEYYTDNECYPDPSILNICGGNGLQPYLQHIPCDPVYKYPYCFFASDPKPTADCYQNYHLLTTLKYFKDPEIKKLGCDGSTYCGWEPECNATSERYGFNYVTSSLNSQKVNLNSIITTPSSTVLPTAGPPGEHACTPLGVCDSYQDPVGSGCGITFQDDHCNNLCSSIPLSLRCKK